jgi:hypothetical protein
MSSGSGDSSPPPSTVKHLRIPDDSMIIKYESTDPTDLLDNPRHQFGDDVYGRVVPEKLGGVLMELLEKYQKLTLLNSTITSMNVKHLLQQDELKIGEIYDIVDKFYVDVPDINCVNSSWITQEHLPILLEKQTLHTDIRKTLVLLQTTIENTREFCGIDECCGRVCEQECENKEEPCPESEEDEVRTTIKTKQTKPKKTKKKQKPAQ